jgi:hypothetical protein
MNITPLNASIAARRCTIDVMFTNATMQTAGGVVAIKLARQDELMTVVK